MWAKSLQQLFLKTSFKGMKLVNLLHLLCHVAILFNSSSMNFKTSKSRITVSVLLAKNPLF